MNTSIRERDLGVVNPGPVSFIRVVQGGQSYNAYLPEINNAAAVLATELDATVSQAQDDIAPVIAGLGYLPPVPYAAGIAVNSTRQTFEHDGFVYAPLAAALPFTTSGAFETAAFRIIQGVVGTDLSAGTGAGMVGFKQAGGVTRTLEDKARELVSITDYGAVAYPSKAAALAGVDSTDAINQAMAVGRATAPIGYFKYSGPLKAVYSGSGLIGAGSDTVLVAAGDLDRHIGVQEGLQSVRFTGFRMIGPANFTGAALNRAITFGMLADWSNITATHWDATGCYVDNVAVEDYCTAVHNAFGDNFGFGEYSVLNLGDAREEPGSYGYVGSGKGLRGGKITVTSALGSYRHAVYLVSGSEDCYVDFIDAYGSALAAFQCRVSEGGTNCRFGTLRARYCNLTPNGTSGVAHWGTVGDVNLDSACYPGFGRIVATNCGGQQMTMRYFNDGVCGDVMVEGHSGAWGASGHYLVEITSCQRTALPNLMATKGFDAAGLNDTSLCAMAVTGSTRSYGGSVNFSGVGSLALRVDTSNYGKLGKVTAAGNYDRAVNINNSTGVRVDSVEAMGTFNYAARFAGTSNYCVVRDVTTLDAPVLGLFVDASTGAQYNQTRRAPGYDVQNVTADSPDVAGCSEAVVTYASAGNLSFLQNGFPGQEVTLTFQNGNTMVVHNTGTGGITLKGAASRVMTQRSVMKLIRHRTSNRWLEVG